MVSTCSEKPTRAQPRLAEVSLMLLIETVPVLVWLTMALSRLFREDRLALPLCTPLSPRQIDGVMSVALCPQVMSQAPQHLHWLFGTQDTSEAGLYAGSFPFTSGCPVQYVQNHRCQSVAYVRAYVFLCVYVRACVGMHVCAGRYVVQLLFAGYRTYVVARSHCRLKTSYLRRDRSMFTKHCCSMF